MPVSLRRPVHGLSAALPLGERDHSGEKREAAPGMCTAPGGGEQLKTRGKPCSWGFGGGRGKPGEHPKTEATRGQMGMAIAATPQGAWPSVPPPLPLRPTRRRSSWERQAMSPGWRHEPHGDRRGAGPTRGRPLRPNGSRPDLRLPLRYRDRPGGAEFSPCPLPRLQPPGRGERCDQARHPPVRGEAASDEACRAWGGELSAGGGGLQVVKRLGCPSRLPAPLLCRPEGTGRPPLAAVQDKVHGQSWPRVAHWATGQWLGGEGRFGAGRMGAAPGAVERSCWQQ